MRESNPTDPIPAARQQTLGDLIRRTAQRVPARTALVFRENRWSYQDLDLAVNRAAHAFAARGVGKGDRIGLLGQNSDSYLIVCQALARLGAITVPINFMLGAAEVEYILGHAEVSAMVVQDSLVEVANAALAGSQAPRPVELRVVLGAGQAGWEPFSALIADGPCGQPEVAIADDDVLQLMYTSGTESRPKGAMMTSRSLIAQYVSCIVDGRFEQQDVEVHALPLFHVAAQHCFLMPGLYLGATNIVLPGADPADILLTVERERATKLFCPPTVWIALLRHPDFDRRDLSSLVKGYYGASIMPVAVIEELTERLPALQLFNFYGQTEMSAVALVLGPEDARRKLGSAGRAALNVETRLVDAAGDPVPAGVEGEIVHRSPHATAGYWRDPDKTAEAYRDGWFHSGDLGIADDEGYITVVDRIKDMIKTGGENVASREVEEALYQHEAVAEVAVFGLPHPRWVEAVTAAVVLRPGAVAEPDALIAACRERLAGFKVPKRIVLVDSLPKNASGKILKRQLRTDFEDAPPAGS